MDLVIAPRPPGSAGDRSRRNSSNTAYDQDASGGSGGAGSGSVATRRKNVRSACQSCRDRKVKCNGSSPCSRCVTLGVECIYAADLDGRTSAAIKRKFDTYEQGQQFLHELLDSIRNNPDAQVSQILSLIRANASLEEIRLCMSQQVTDLRRQGKQLSSELEELQKEAASLNRRQADSDSTASRRGILQIVRLVDEPLHRVSSSPWTNVIDDDDLMSNLISVWLTWDYLIYNWMDLQPFLRDMHRGQLDSPYCSPFLMNCILAWACPYSDWQEARSVRGKTSELLHEFLDEAKRLLEPEIARGSSLTLLQGLMFLFLSISFNGQDRLGHQYLLHAIDLAKQLPKISLKKLATPDTDHNELARAIDHTCWGIYNTVVAISLALLRPMPVKVPRNLHSISSRDDHGSSWTPYPQQGNSIPSYLQELFVNLSQFSELTGSIAQSMIADDDGGDDDGTTEQGFSPIGIRKEKDIVERYLQIVRQLADLPRHLQPMEGAPPSVCVHHLWMNAQLMSVLLYLKKERPHSSAPIRQLAQKCLTEKALDCARICRYYMAVFSNSLASNCVTQGISMSLYILIEDAANIEEYSQQVTDLCILLRSLSRRWPLSMAIMRMVQLKARELGVRLPPSTDKLFEDFENIDWRKEGERMMTFYPDPDSTMSLNDGVVDMKEFLVSMHQMDLDE